jgi:16S rRNA (cytosine1402-N4)-methyltransferase
MPLDTIKHYPVMANEVLSFITNNKTIIDCTFGGGGYSSKILKKYRGSYLIGLDRDKNTSVHALKLKKNYFDRF